MSSVFYISLFVQFIGIAWSLLLFRQINDRRILFFTLLIALLSLHQILSASEHDYNRTLIATISLRDWFDVFLSTTTFFTTFYLGRLVVERKKAEDIIRESEARFSGILDIASDAIISVNSEQRIVLFNKGAEQTFGYTASEVLGAHLNILLPEKWRADHTRHVQAFAIGTVTNRLMGARSQVVGLRKTGEEFPGEASISKLSLDDKILLTVIFRDISTRKEAEAQIQSSLKEKEVLLKEIHHRVKNNLQVISSLLSLQSRHARDTKALQVIQESQNRVKSIALIHEMLYQSNDLARIDFADYVKTLATRILRSYGKLQTFLVQVDTHQVALDLDTAIPCGLIINELVTNCAKHAFPESEMEGKKGEISIELQNDSHGHYQLIVRDNGIGFPKDIDFQHPETLGLRLVMNLTAQLGGQMNLDRSVGTSFIVSFFLKD